MAEEKTIVSGVKVELKPFDGWTNLTPRQRKMKNIHIQQDLHMCILGIRAQAQGGDRGGLEQGEF